MPPHEFHTYINQQDGVLVVVWIKHALEKQALLADPTGGDDLPALDSALRGWATDVRSWRIRLVVTTCLRWIPLCAAGRQTCECDHRIWKTPCAVGRRLFNWSPISDGRLLHRS